ncbi:hypothetical protein AB0N05_21890 [Nocardia sp. NPDC051030]|uniref:hypothetical protein n=1 Tax=Nocardia sp. NPDC051030 TaxID=3155162 RepID=UPI0034146A15
MVAGITGVLLLAGLGARSAGARGFAGLAAGLAIGTTVPPILDVLSFAWAIDDFGHAISRLGSNFWLLAFAAILSIAVLVTTGIAIAGANTRPSGSGSAPGVSAGHSAAGGRVSGAVAGVFLILGAVLTIGGSFLNLTRHYSAWSWHESGGPIRMLGPVLVLAGLISIAVAVLLFAGSGVRSQLVRIAGPLAAGLLSGTTLTVVSQTMERTGLVMNTAGPGAWVITAAFVLSIGAIIASLVSNLAAPQPQPALRPPPAFASPPPPNPFAPQPLPTHPPRMARVYDGRSTDGRPTVDRPALNPHTRTAVLAYLESAPIVLAARSLDEDEFAPGDRDVPLNFHTDGFWIWSGAVPHYLHKHGVPPEPDLVRHIVTRGFRHGEVSEAAKDLAVKAITGG